MSRLRNRGRVVAYPRGRPRILPFPATGNDGPPTPALEHHDYYIFNGQPIHLIGERWLAEDAACSPSPTFADPMQPGIAVTTRLEDIHGQLIQAVSYEAFQAYKQALLAGSSARPAGVAAGQA